MSNQGDNLCIVSLVMMCCEFMLKEQRLRLLVSRLDTQMLRSECGELVEYPSSRCCSNPRIAVTVAVEKFAISESEWNKRKEPRNGIWMMDQVVCP